MQSRRRCKGANGTRPHTAVNAPLRFQEELGLTLEATKGPVDVWVIDSIQKPIPD